MKAVTSVHVLLCVFISWTAYSQSPFVEVKAEEDVYTVVSPNNGSGPMWSYGCTSIARLGDSVYVSQMETGEGVPLLCNTRWRLLKREDGKWNLVAEADGYRQREPCSVATTSGSELYLYVNDSTQPPGTKYGNCIPHLVKFMFKDDKFERVDIMPSWVGEPYYTDHSYRGFAADSDAGRLLMLNIDAKTSVQNACLLSSSGKTLAKGAITFPIRACYPQVAVRGDAVHVLAVGDIVEPVEEWRTYKFEQTKREWDYVFRILYYALTPDLTATPFAPPIEIANVDKTAGYIGNQDLWVSPTGEAYIMYTETEVASTLMRDKFFPGKSVIPSLLLAVVKDGAVVSRRVLIAGNETVSPGCARFHVAQDGALFAVLWIGGAHPGNYLMRIQPAQGDVSMIPIPFKKPLGSFSLASVRAGNRPSNVIDILGQASDDTMAYAQVAIR